MTRAQLDKAILAEKLWTGILSEHDREDVELIFLWRRGRVVGLAQLDVYGCGRGLPVYLDRLAVNPDILLGRIKEKGVGRELLSKVIEKAQRLRCGLILASSELATGFYLRLGLKPLKTHPGEFCLSRRQVSKWDAAKDRRKPVDSRKRLR
jgi:GNAT superfamily N-acetyltransferase